MSEFLWKTLKKVSDGYKKIRNTIRYLLANTSDFEPDEDAVSYEQLNPVDQFIMIKLNQLITEVRTAYDQYDFMTVNKKLFQFITGDLSAFYLDFAKDILYIDSANSQRRRSMQTVLYQSLVVLTKLLTPIIPHTTEEIWQFLAEPASYVQLTEMPTAEHFTNEEECLAQFDEFLKLRKAVLKAMENARNDKVIGKPSEAKLILYLTEADQQALSNLKIDVAQILMVSQLVIKPVVSANEDVTSFGDRLAIEVQHADGETCERCRLIKTDVGSDPDYPDFCARCAKIVRSSYPETAQQGFDE